jgi:hypothetical protein
MPSEERRRSERISLLSPIRVRGTDAVGEAFSEEARTLLVTHHGAAIVISRQLAPEQQLMMRCYGPGDEVKVRVVGQIESRPEGLVYGVQYVDPNVNPWNIKFPAPSAAENAVGRLLLQCANCQTRELTYVDELEAEVFGANQCLNRFCTACRDTTLWKAIPHELSAAGGEPSSSAEAPQELVSALVPRTRNDRRHVRIKLKLKACIRHPELGEEVVECLDVSRGGHCFTSQKEYPKDALIETAVPYLPGQANIFTRARIAHALSVPGETGLFKYGVSYIPLAASSTLPAPA